MVDRSGQRHSFVLRIWCEEGSPWRGWIQHTASQEESYLRSLAELLAFIQARTGNLDQGGEAPGDAGGQKDDSSAGGAND